MAKPTNEPITLRSFLKAGGRVEITKHTVDGTRESATSFALDRANEALLTQLSNIFSPLVYTNNAPGTGTGLLRNANSTSVLPRAVRTEGYFTVGFQPGENNPHRGSLNLPPVQIDGASLIAYAGLVANEVPKEMRLTSRSNLQYEPLQP